MILVLVNYNNPGSTMMHVPTVLFVSNSYARKHARNKLPQNKYATT